MCGGRERVSGLLATLEKRGIDLATLNALPAYQKLLQKRAPPLDENDNKKDAKRKAKGSDKCLNGSVNAEGGAEVGGGKAPRGFCYALLVCLLSVAVAAVYHYELNTHQGFARFWLRWENVDLNAEQVLMSRVKVTWLPDNLATWEGAGGFEGRVSDLIPVQERHAVRVTVELLAS
ncbi:hypothetical protein E2C01_047075 [Portunus trituberculatus]|uniref:Uncharacterized protein n=1 Tax=Portunus trituberculatus TaxID=210409 RepID=A0A5B7G7U2_PORTR|nr:hypothetical protein [Portunus trituberculatus]